MRALASARMTSYRRWWVLGLLACFSTVSYIERINLTVAARFIRDEFGLTDIQIGWSFSIFLASYTLSQVPAGLLVDRFGPRRILTVAALLWFLITVALGLFAGHVVQTATGVVTTLVICRFLLGIVEAPTYPGAAALITRWFPAHARGIPNAVIQGTSFAGEALTLILLAFATAYLGWRNAIFASAIPALLIALAWWFWGADRPEGDPRVSSDELAYIRSVDAAQDAEGLAEKTSILDVIKDRLLVTLSLAYFFHGYVTYLFFFWFYIYLVDERHFSVAAGGLVGALPTIGAAICALFGGVMSDRLTRRFGPIIGRRRLIAGAGFGGAAGLLIGTYASESWIAVAGFIVAVGSRGLVESAFWSLVNYIGGARSGTAAGMMNGAGNLGGVVSTLLAPVLVATMGWTTALTFAAGATTLTGLILFLFGGRSRGAAA